MFCRVGTFNIEDDLQGSFGLTVEHTLPSDLTGGFCM